MLAVEHSATVDLVAYVGRRILLRTNPERYAAAIRGLDAMQISERLRIDPRPSGYQIIEFSSKDILNIASPINRTNPKFVGRSHDRRSTRIRNP